MKVRYLKKMKWNVLTAFVVFSIIGCGEEPKPLPTVPPPLPVIENPTYTKDIKPLFKLRCMACHNDSFRPTGHSTDWLNYKIVIDRLDKIDYKVRNRLMPPGGAMPKTDYDLVLKWLDQGAKE